jgi:hypothetical protein
VSLLTILFRLTEAEVTFQRFGSTTFQIPAGVGVGISVTSLSTGMVSPSAGIEGSLTGGEAFELGGRFSLLPVEF